MLYPTADDWQDAPNRRVMLFGMSGLGKTHVSAMLREEGGWFHYSIDYRIGTRYMGEHILDNYKAEAMKSPFLAELLRSDSIHIASKITFHNLAPLSTYLGKPGDPEKGGIPFEEYRRRQSQHRTAEIAALLDTGYFIERAGRIYGYEHFVCDSSGSICEVVDPWNPADPVMTALAGQVLPVWIRGSEAHAEELVRRFRKAPKPMYYRPEILDGFWNEYLAVHEITEAAVDPDDFARWSFRRALELRLPRYAQMARQWGAVLEADDVARLRSTEDFIALVTSAIAARPPTGH